MPVPDEVTLFVRGLTDLHVPYMVTGATAAIIYGQPRVTNDLDVVLALEPPSDPPEIRSSEITRESIGPKRKPLHTHSWKINP